MSSPELLAYYAARAGEYEAVYAKSELQDDLATLRIVKRGEEIFAGCNDTRGRRVRCRVRLGKAVRPSAK